MSHRGFTLIELSIVLVIIGLVVSGILFGKDLIHQAQLRSVISTKDALVVAARTFQGKYNQLPGDMDAAKASNFGFFTFTGPNVHYIGNGDGILGGNLTGGLEGVCSGENSVFFRHLAEAKLIALPTSVPLEPSTGISTAGLPTDETTATPFTLSRYLPSAGSTFFCANSLDQSNFFRSAGINNQQNALTLRGPSTVANSSIMEPSLSAMDLYSLDQKIDDGNPVTGKVLNTPWKGYTFLPVFWSATADAAACVFGGSDSFSSLQVYNTASAGANNINCQPAFVW
jgi:prepilin-type N-terminal cleavage/methylation domain-containing protein